MSSLQQAAQALKVREKKDKLIKSIEQETEDTIQELQAIDNNSPTQHNGYSWLTQIGKLQTAIKVGRAAKGWTQRDLAKASGMSQGTITRMERHGWTSLNAFMQVAHALGKELIIT